jgi:hypothetical protein
MINMEETNNENESTGANGPVSVDKLKEYGKQAYKPLVNVIAKYQDEFTPYLTALSKGLQGGWESLSQDKATDAEKYVANFFQEAADGIDQACRKLESKDVGALTSFLSEQADKRPSVMFSTSYMAGLFFGRIGRHIARQKISGKSGETTAEPRKFDGSTDFNTSFDSNLDQSIH